MLAYNQRNTGLEEMGEHAIAATVIRPIKQQEPGHFAFHQMSATAMVQDRVLRPWQLFLARVPRERSFHLVGTNALPAYEADMGRVATDLGIDADLAGYAREIGRLESRLLWAHRRGMDVPPCILRALRESVELYREQLDRAVPAR